MKLIVPMLGKSQSVEYHELWILCVRQWNFSRCLFPFIVVCALQWPSCSKFPLCLLVAMVTSGEQVGVLTIRSGTGRGKYIRTKHDMLDVFCLFVRVWYKVVSKTKVISPSSNVHIVGLWTKLI